MFKYKSLLYAIPAVLESYGPLPLMSLKFRGLPQIFQHADARSN
jgi:hypothetical protein